MKLKHFRLHWAVFRPLTKLDLKLVSCSRWTIAAIAVCAALACQTVAGIETRRLGPCGEYCDTVMAACTGENAAYANYEACMGVCQLLPEGSDLEPEASNSVACRLHEAREAVIGEPDVHCMRAGPGGSERCSSATNTSSIACESYCTLYEKACGSEWYDYGTLEECTHSCTALRDRGAFDAIHDHDGDTLQCRLVHVSSATLDAETHCEHAALAPPVSPCTDPPEARPDCERYCDVIGVACEGDLAQYETTEGATSQCRTVCEALEFGQNSDTKTNTVGCRLYHAYNSLLDPEAHCSHAGPTGDGHCGTVSEESNAICDSYCAVLERACPDAYHVAFIDTGDCATKCASLSGAERDAHYSVKSGKIPEDSLHCRFFQAVRAIAGDIAACPAAFGSEVCR
jgi:hypothetical protein